MSIVVGLQIGHSFFEIIARLQSETKKTKSPPFIFFQRFYLSQTNLETGLKKSFQILAELHPQIAVSELRASSYLFEKIFETRLGGSVAQLVTEGFQDWLRLRQPVQQSYYDTMASRFEALGSQENIYPIKERISAGGKVLEALDKTQILDLVPLLKDKKIEKVCLNFLFSNLNSDHLLRAKDILETAGFQVFMTAPRSQQDPREDEAPQWRKNVLNACLSGSFQEQKAEILKGCEGYLQPDQVFYFDGTRPQVVGSPSISLADSLFASTSLLNQFYSDQSEVLFLGLEKWFISRPKNLLPQWNSIWGAMEGPVPETRQLELQPTVLLRKSPLGELTFSGDKSGFEPGPMIFGKSLRPTLIDLIVQHKGLDFLKTWSPAAGLGRFENTLLSYAKEIPDLRKKNISEIKTELYEHFLDLLSFEIALKISKEEKDAGKKIMLTGVFAPVLIHDIQKRFQQTNSAAVQFVLCKNSQEISALTHVMAHVMTHVLGQPTETSIG